MGSIIADKLFFCVAGPLLATSQEVFKENFNEYFKSVRCSDGDGTIVFEQVTAHYYYYVYCAFVLSTVLSFLCTPNFLPFWFFLWTQFGYISLLIYSDEHER